METAPNPQKVPSLEPSADGRLDSWKEIAAYLKHSERTVRRWERAEGLPAHRHPHHKRASVYAFKTELDGWWQKRSANLEGRAAFEKRALSAAALLGVLVVAGLTFWWLRPAARERPVFRRAVPLTSYPGDETFPTLSPDGSQVAFSWSGETLKNPDIYVKVVGSEAPLRVTTDPRADVAPAWSPDGRTIAFLRLLSGSQAHVMLVPPLGGGPERTLAEVYAPWGTGMDLAVGHFLAWSPDSKWLVVAAAVSTGTYRLTAHSAETGEERVLTQPDAPLIGDAGPSFSPNGRTLAFNRHTSPGQIRIYLLDLTSDLRPVGNPRPLTSESEHNRSRTPVWTADGREVIFISGANDSEMRLWKIAASGGKPEPLEFGYSPVINLARAGSRLVFSHRLNDSDIWRVDLHPGEQTGPPVRVISSTRSDETPQFSPDGNRIAFRSNRAGDPEIYVCNPDGSNAAKLTSFGGPTLGPPSWSGDRKQLAFTVVRKGSVQIQAIDIAGGRSRTLHSDSSMVHWIPLNWSGDGNWVYFASRRSGEVQSWKAPVGGGAAFQVTRNGGFEALESPDGEFVYYLKGTLLQLWRVPLGGGEERQVVEKLGYPLDLVKGGLYFVQRRGPSRLATLQFFSFATGAIQQAAELGPLPMSAHSGAITVSPDGRTLVYSQSESRGTDLMLVENFR